MVSSVGIGTPRQQTPMLITEGNALSLLNRLSWDTLRCVCVYVVFFSPMIVSAVYPTGPHPPLRLARQPNQG